MNEKKIKWSKPVLRKVKIEKITLGGSQTAAEQGAPSSRMRP